MVLIDKGLLSVRKQEQADSILEIIRQIAQVDLSDFFTFDIFFKELISHATVGGARYSIVAKIEGREFDTFRLDIVLAETDMIRQIPQTSHDWLGFAGINSPTFYLLNLEMQYAEKLHAYTYQWESAENGRTKDLVDMLMLSKYIAPQETALAIKELFSARRTHDIPIQLMPPPKSWEHSYRDYAREYGYDGTMQACFKELELFHAKLLEEGLLLQMPIISEKKENTNSMTTKTNMDFDVDAMIENLVKTNAFPNLKEKNLTECIALAIKESQTANTAHAHQWKALLQALLVGAIVNKIDKLQK